MLSGCLRNNQGGTNVLRTRQMPRYTLLPILLTAVMIACQEMYKNINLVLKTAAAVACVQ
jgi:hypothetical protein